MRYFLVTLWVLVLVSVRAEENVSAPDFSKYPQISHYLNGHTNALWHFQKKNVLSVSAFPAGDRYELMYRVTEDGKEMDCRFVWDRGMHSRHEKQLSATNLTNLRSAIRKLPAQSVSPPIESLVVVSFREGTNWTSRSYDADNLPQSMRQIYDIVGERFESKKGK